MHFFLVYGKGGQTFFLKGQIERKIYTKVRIGRLTDNFCGAEKNISDHILSLLWFNRENMVVF